MCFLSGTFKILKKAERSRNRTYNKKQSLLLFRCKVICTFLSIVFQFDVNLTHANIPKLKISNTSVVISDPVNGSNNPKRIPGAIIRYTIKAENKHAAPAENVVISLNLTEVIGTSKNVNWYNNFIVKSPNIHSGTNKSLTGISGDDEGEFISNILTVRCGNISNIAPCIVTYDVEITQG